MPLVTDKSIWNIISRDNSLFIPENIEKAIVPCIKSDMDLVRQTGLEIQREYKPVNQAISIDYDRIEVIDAYSLYYLRRNTLIPRIALRDLTLNHNLQQFPSHLNMLDVGSGTGAVVLGFLEMFLHAPLTTIEVHVDAIDKSDIALWRLREHLSLAGLGNFIVETTRVDVSNSSELTDFLNHHGPYNMVFAANLLNEIEHTDACCLLGSIAGRLTEKATIVTASAQKDFIKELQLPLIAMGCSTSLNVYYPCPALNVAPHDCWFWRKHDYNYTKAAVEKKYAIANNREQLAAMWLILSNAGFTIFDDYKSQNNQLEWGVFRIRGKDARVSNCEICSDGGIITINPQSVAYSGGSLVGFSTNPLAIKWGRMSIAYTKPFHAASSL